VVNGYHAGSFVEKYHIMTTVNLLRLAAIAALLATGSRGQQASQPHAEDCAGCHDSGPRIGKRQAGVPPGFNAAALKASPHAALECTACHSDIKEVPHPEKLAKVDCGLCHGEEATQYTGSVHGKKAAQNDPYAPGCKLCHGTHDILPPSNLKSSVSTVNVPRLCGQCHREDAEVSKTRVMSQTNIWENYKDSIHGIGLFQQGLTVTAVCTSCHTAHNQLPHTDPRSSIAKQNIAKTCTRCHAQIEAVHQKVIRGELWEKEPHLIPACVDCHEPHKIRKVFYTEGMSNGDCMRCHANPALKGRVGGKVESLYVNLAELAGSRHSRIQCVQCHTGGTPSNVRACISIPDKVNCNICHEHEKEAVQYSESRHGTLAAQGSPDAPICQDCHGTHGVLGKLDPASPSFSRNIPTLCARCHQAGHKAAVRYTGKQDHIVERYRESIHGTGLLQAGLTVTANCADCHTAHHELPGSDPRSSVNRANIAETCAQCHRGIYELFTASIHSPKVDRSGKPLPVCADCHSAHSIQRTDLTDFRLNIMDQCGRCHQQITEAYFETFHGKVSKLGYLKTAKCYDCHGAHDILPVTDPRSHLSRTNIVATCGKCHTGSHRQFAGYLTHATHHDPKKYPFLFVTFWGMTALLMGTLVISGTHTALWLPRSLEYRRQTKNGNAESGTYVRRFRRFHRNLHLMVVSSFLGLASTGMILKFSYAGWAKLLARLLGGFEAAGLIHRFCAGLTFTYFGLHLYDLWKQKRASGKSWRQFIAGEESMLFNTRDWHELVASLKWFFKRGPRPEYGRWTYWEKFDYFAVFWGVAVIGGTGLLLWFPEIFTHIFPGWAVNVATTIHSDEALLAVSFIFVVHFFNTHFRPEKFPIDTVIFTEGMPLEEFQRDRPREYRQLVETGELERMTMPAPAARDVRFWRRLGFTALTIGLILIGLIIYAMIFAYR
jgi:cytochrome b subunit of formate dehydrogenase